MALEFDLNLVKMDDKAIFSYGALDLTAKIVKTTNPRLAQAVLDVLAQPPLPISLFDDVHVSQQFFHVQLDMTQINGLIAVIRTIADNERGMLTPGLIVLAKTLLIDWLALAQQHAEQQS